MAILCALDFGNTRIKYGIYNHAKSPKYGFIPYDDGALDIFLKENNPSDGIFCHTKTLDEEILSLLYASNFKNINEFQKLGFKNLYKSPLTLGQDRKAVLSAISQKENLINGGLIIDLGTCATFDYLDSSLNYYGGNIAPGLRMRLRAMHEFTSKLPLVEPIADWKVIGSDTQTALVAGAMSGLLNEIKGYIRHFDQPSSVFLTGGDAVYFINRVENCIFAPNLVLDGLVHCFNLNK